jgi:hypothetical protein
MRAIATAFLTLTVFLAGAGCASAEEALDPSIAQCIRDNAPAVEQAVGSLNDAVDFLARKVCAVPVAAFAERVRVDAMKEWSDRMKANCLKTRAHTATANDEPDPCDSNFDYTGFSLLATRTGLPETPAPPGATALAAKLLLDLRLSHLNKAH